MNPDTPDPMSLDAATLRALYVHAQGINAGNKVLTAFGSQASQPGVSHGAPPPTSAVPQDRQAYQEYAHAQVDPSQVPYLDAVVNRESGWNPTAQNPTSSAYGIGQFLDSTWQGVQAQKTSDPYQQIQAMLRYITQRYGSPQAAWQHEQQAGWY